MVFSVSFRLYDQLVNLPDGSTCITKKTLPPNLRRVPKPQAALHALEPLIGRVVLVVVEPQLILILEGLPTIRANTGRFHDSLVNLLYVRIQIVLFGEPLGALGWNSIHFTIIARALASFGRTCTCRMIFCLTVKVTRDFDGNRDRETRTLLVKDSPHKVHTLGGSGIPS